MKREGRTKRKKIALVTVIVKKEAEKVINSPFEKMPKDFWTLDKDHSKRPHLTISSCCSKGLSCINSLKFF